MTPKKLLPDDISEAPRSVQLIFEALIEDGVLSLDALVERTSLPKRTCRYALGILRASDLVTKVPDFEDLRRGLYAIPSSLMLRTESLSPP
ncbi:MAG: hypothetical protein ACXADX_13525 [Candidatus Hodarchaeales archaeon]|jgi:hypothetical protein